MCVCAYIYIYIHIHSTCISWFSLCCSFVVTRLQKIEILLILPGSKSWVQWNSAPFAMKKGHDPRYPQVKCRSLLQQRSSHDHHSSGAIANLVVLATKDGLSGRWDTYFAIIMGYIWYIWYIYIYIYIIYMWRGPLCIEWRGLGKNPSKIYNNCPKVNFDFICRRSTFSHFLPPLHVFTFPSRFWGPQLQFHKRG